MPTGSPMQTAARLARAVGLGAVVALLVATCLLVIGARGNAAGWRDIGSLRSADSALLYATALLAGAALAWLAGRRSAGPPLSLWSSALILVSLFGFASALGRHLAIVALAATFAVAASALPRVRGRGALGFRLRDRTWAGLTYLLTLVPMCVFPMDRHWAFGSGSWDMGCVVHNAFLVSRFLPTISTVLGGPDFLGDHFSVGLYLYVPYFWVAGSGYGLLLLQAANLAVSAPAIYGIARRHGASPASSFTLGLAVGLSFGLQSAAFFDLHHITLGFGFFAAALWAIETRRFGWATALLFVFSTFKESIGLYVVGLGIWLLVRSLSEDAKGRRYGVAWIIGGSVWFMLVTRVFMPWFGARGVAPESHETFADFGPTVFEAARSMVAEPALAYWFMFLGDEKLMSLFTTLANVGWLTLLSPSILLASAPLLAERFLSSKPSMWHMGFHYAAPLALYAGWGAARALATAEAWLEVRARLPRPRVSLVVFVLTCAITTLAFGYRHPANFIEGRPSYCSRPDKRAANAAAIEWLRERAPSEPIAAQNRLLPHVASRRFIYRLEDYERADWVLLSLDEDAWPYPASHPRRLAGKLDRDPGWALVFDQQQTRIYQRVRPSK